MESITTNRVCCVKVKTLIEKAAAHVGSKAEVSRRMGVRPQRVNDWANGQVTCPLERQVVLCQLAELSESETLDHVREAAGVPTKKSGAWASTPATVFAFAVSAGLAIDRLLSATMYRASTR